MHGDETTDAPLAGPAGASDQAEAELLWNPELAQTLYNFLHWIELGSDELEKELEKLERQYHDSVYAELLYLMCHLRFEPGEAKAHWDRVMELRRTMAERLGTPVDLRVALVAYFVQVNRQFKNPKIIEMRLFHQTRASAYRDELTGLRNYRFFGECLSQEISRAAQYRAPLSLVMIDVDNFKLYNDRNGHEAGNQALASIARLLHSTMRKVDVAARYGGEEFAMILPSTPKVGARQVAERVRALIQGHRFEGEDALPGGRLTVSIGVATYPADADEASELVRRADRAMYVAKASGKNQVQLYALSSRSYPRVDAALRGSFRRLATEAFPLETIRISEGGLSFSSTEHLPVGAVVDVTLELPEPGGSVEVCGRVVKSTEAGAGSFQTAIRLIELSSNDQNRLIAYIRGLMQAEELGAIDLGGA